MRKTLITLNVFVMKWLNAATYTNKSSITNYLYLTKYCEARRDTKVAHCVCIESKIVAVKDRQVQKLIAVRTLFIKAVTMCSAVIE